MSIPIEVAWLIPLLIPFIIGFLVGAIIKRAFKLLILVAILVVVLVLTGILGLTFTDVFDSAMKVLPLFYDSGVGWLNVLPYSSISFLIGLVLGIILL